MKLTAGIKNIRFEPGRLVITYPATFEQDMGRLAAYIGSGKKVSIEIKRERRSVDANAYCWVLCQKLAEKLSDDGTLYTKEQVYRYAIKQVTQPSHTLVEDRAVEAYIRAWGKNGIGWVAETVGEAALRGYTMVAVYQGSSTYDSKQMSRLIDFLVDACREQGIETREPGYIDALLKDLEKAHSTKNT